MSDFTPETPGSNGPSPLGPRPQSGAATQAPRFAPRPDDAPQAEGPSPQGPPAHSTPQSPAPGPAQHAAPQQANVPPGAGPAGMRAAEIDVKGRIHIADEVVEKVASLAAYEVEGVADLGGDFARAVESVRERIGIGNKRGDQGVKADVKGNEVYVNVTIMVEFGHVVLDVAHRVQQNVASKTQRMLGLKVVEVNVTVDDVCTAEQAERDEDEPKVVVTGG